MLWIDVFNKDILDKNFFGNKSYISKKANIIYRAIAAEEQFIKIAVLGDPDTHPTVIKYVAPFARMFTKVAWVTTSEEAEIWLNK